MMPSAPTRPVMRWHGSKFRLAPWIIGHFPLHRFYVEPYCGSAACMLAKPRSEGEVIGDLDGDVVNVFRVLRDRSSAAELERILRLTPYAHAEFRLAYEPVTSGDPVERARRTIVRSFMGYGSNSASRLSRHGFRRGRLTNRTRVPAAEWSTWPDEVSGFVERLGGVIIEERPAVEVIALYDGREVLHYIDPPYLTSTRTDGRRGYMHEMTDEDHIELAEVLYRVAGMVVISGYPSRLYDDLYRDWHRVERDTVDAASNRRTEVLWLSPSAVARGRQLRLMEVEG